MRRGRFWFDQGSAAFYSSIKKKHRSCVKGSVSLIHADISLAHTNALHSKMPCEQFNSIFFRLEKNKCEYLNILWLDCQNTCIHFCVLVVKL